MTYFLFLRSLVSAAGKCLLTLFCTLLAPMVQCAVGDSQIACNLRLRCVARSHQLDRFLLKFSRKGSLLLLHDPFPFCGEFTLSSLLPPLLWVKTTLPTIGGVVESWVGRYWNPDRWQVQLEVRSLQRNWWWSYLARRSKDSRRYV